MNSVLRSRAHELEEKLDLVCQSCGRARQEIKIIAITKTQPVATVREAVAAGFVELGENRIQEAEGKISQLEPGPVWHLVGHLQTNKAHKAALLFDWVQSVDSARAAEALGRGATEADKRIGVLVQVNTTAEGQKSGCDPALLGGVLEAVVAQPNLRLSGLMTLGPLSMDERGTREAFSLASRLRDLWQRQLAPGTMDVLSMGMSGDWPWAIAHGATWIRLGTAIFGDRV